MSDSMVGKTVNTVDESSYSNSMRADSSVSSTSFVDYVPPPDVKILPPAKYKLWLIVFFLVYFAAWVTEEAKFLEFLRFKGWLSPEGSFFLMLAIIVFVLTYGTLDLFIACLTFKTKEGKVLGMGAWLKQPRAQWMYSHDNFLFQLMAGVVHILEEGFGMFDAPPKPEERATMIPKQFKCNNQTCQRTLKIEHRIKPEKVDEYKKWCIRIGNAVKKASGYISTEVTELHDMQVGDEEEGLPLETTRGGETEGATDKAQATSAQLQVIHVKFANIDYLNEWMLSPRREVLMKALQPMLVEPDIVLVQSSRALPDAFSDLLTRQGVAVSKSPPKKWKVWWLTLVALYITLNWCNSFLEYYFGFWGLVDADARLIRLVSIFIGTFVNSYVMMPLFLFVFDHWLQHDRAINGVTKVSPQPWKTLDQGFVSLMPKVVLTLALYGGCLIAIMIEKRVER